MKLKIGTRLNATFACILALMLILCVVVDDQMAKMQAHMKSIVTERITMQRLALQGQYGTNNSTLYLFRGIVEKTPEAISKNIAQVAAQAKENAAVYETLDAKLDVDPNARGMLENLIDVRKRYKAAIGATVAKLRAGDVDAARDILVAAMPTRDELLKGQALLADYEQRAMEESIRVSEIAYKVAKNILWGLFGVSLVLAIVLCILVKRSIVKPLEKVVDGANALASGDLSFQVDVHRSDEVGDLANAVNTAVTKLASLLSRVKDSSESIATATHQVASGAADLSHRTEEQAASLEETTGSMEELTSTVRQNAENAKQANKLASAASAVAQRGGDEVSRVVTSMQSISASAGRMTEIIGVIEGIAFQTNILALNAAVEAARAGEHGRGFNVVATEVRALAQRSATAAKEVKDLIGHSDGEVRQGSALAHKAGETILEVVTSFKRVTDLMTEVAAASGEQTSSIEQVNTTIAQMDHVTQQNAALVEETAAASESMAEQANGLHQAVCQFKLPAQA